MTSLMVVLIRHEPWSGADTTGRTPETCWEVTRPSSRLKVLAVLPWYFQGRDVAGFGSCSSWALRMENVIPKHLQTDQALLHCGSMIAGLSQGCSFCFHFGFHFVKPKGQDKEWLFECRLWRGRYDRTFKWHGSSKLSGRLSHGLFSL